MNWWTFAPAVPAFLLAGGVAVLGRALRRPWLSALASGAGLLLGWWWTFGLLTASPRQLPERLPLLALGLLAMAAVGGMAPRRPAIGVLAALSGAVASGWWMAGAPLTAADLATAWPVLAGVAAGSALALGPQARRDSTPWCGVWAAAALLAGLALAPLPGPAVVLGASLLAASLGSALGATLATPRGLPGPTGDAIAALPVAVGLAALAAVPLLARGAPSDWLVAATPLAVLWLAPVIAGRLAAPMPAPAVLAAAPLLGLACLLR